jgi:hypothetical protein
MKDDAPEAEDAEAEAPEAEAPEAPEDASEADEQAAADQDSPSAEEPAEPVAPTEPERPLFTEGWPVSADLDRLLAAFERGNYAFVREEAPKVAARTKNAKVKAAALDLRRRIDPAPLSGILILVGIGILVVLAGHYLGKHNPGAPPAAPTQSPNQPLQPTNR